MGWAMSKDKVIVLAVLKGGMSKSEAARRYGVSRQWVHELLRRHAQEVEAGLTPRSRRPGTSPHTITATLEDLNEQLAKFRQIYNHERPHRALNRRTPAEAYEATPKSAPTIAAQGEHWRVRTDRVDADGKVTLRHAGRLRHLGIGRAHKHKRIILLARDANVTAVEHGTGEILAEFTINPARGYQPKKQNTPGPKTGGVNDVPTHP
jgi:transposase